MKENPLRKLQTLGQSIWLDYIRCDMISGAQLKHFIEEDGLLGMTTNPSIFEKAIAESQLYDKVIADLVGKGKKVQEIYETICLRDVQNAADKFKFTFTKTGGKDGYVSMEVNPHLAYDTDGTIKEARRLWVVLNRPNVLIKVPATKEGLPAIRQLISEGINVNVTLLFSLVRYSEVAEAYIAGIEDRKKEGKAVDKIASVASFFLSRIDAVIDPKEEDYAASVVKMSLFASIIRGEVAISSAKLAYKIYQERFETTEFSQLGASPQRLLWASTSSKNPADSDVKYVEALIGPNTVNTIPLQTFEAYRDLSGDKIFRYYRSRFQIEFLYRDAKQFCGLTNCQARSKNKLNFHFNAALTAVNLAKIDWFNTKTDESSQFSMSDYKIMYNNELLLKIFIQRFGINPNTEKNKNIIAELRNWGKIAA